MVAVVSYPTPDFDHPDEKEHRRQLAQAIRSLRDGKVNTALDFDLSTTAGTTTVQDIRVAATSRVVLTAGNDHGAAHLASGTVEVPPASIRPGQFTVAHTLSGLTRSYRAVILA